MCIAPTFALAFGRATLAAGLVLRPPGDVLLCLVGTEPAVVREFARRLTTLDFRVRATSPTTQVLAGEGIDVIACSDHSALEEIRGGGVAALFVTATRRSEIDATRALRCEAAAGNVPYFTTVAAGRAILAALEAVAQGASAPLLSLQEWQEAL